MGCESSASMVVQIPHKQEPIPSQAQQYLSLSDFSKAEQVANQYFKVGKCITAIQIYQKIIESNYLENQQIEGLGNSELSASRYEWFIYKWYDESRQTAITKANPYDALSLCYCQIRSQMKEELDKGIIWYEEMLGEIQSYSLYMGYANILYNRERFDEAINIYNKVIELKPTMVNAYVCIALCYQFKRIDIQKAISMASKIISIYPQNIYALFILAKNEANIEQKIKKLKALSQKNPSYVRATNEIGITYGRSKDYKQAINWYKKCIQVAPQYASAYSNVGVNLELLKEHTEALSWYFRAAEKDYDYKTAYRNITDILDDTKMPYEQFVLQTKKYPELSIFWLNYYIGLVYYEKRKYEESIKWLQEALKLNPSNFKINNVLGMYYDAINDFPNSQKYYLECIKQNPSFASAYFNLGIVSKKQGQTDKAIEWYQKSTEVNPRYSLPYNNLGNIYKAGGDFWRAIDNYKKAVQYNSTYTLSYANLGICYLSLRKYNEAFDAFERAKALLPTDNNGLSEQNKAFLKETLQNFNKQAQIQKNSGKINAQQKSALFGLLNTYESNFTGNTANMSKKSFNPKLLEVVHLIYDSQFGLKNIQQIYKRVQVLFNEDEDYFHIIPQIFIECHQSSKKPLKEVNEQLEQALKKLLAMESGGDISPTKVHQISIKLKHFSPGQPKIDLLKDSPSFANYEALCGKVSKINNEVEKYLAEFIDMVEDVRKRSNGIEFVAKMKIPKYQSQQLRHRLLIMNTIFKEQLNAEKSQAMAAKIEQEVKKDKGSNKDMVKKIEGVLAKQINFIISQRTKNKVPIELNACDLIKGKIMFKSIEDLSKGIQVTDNICHLRGYEIIGLQNRLTNRETKDVVLTIKVKEAICEFRLTLKRSQEKLSILKALRQLQTCSFGISSASYIFMSRTLSYSLYEICTDLVEELGQSQAEDEKKLVEAGKYIISKILED